MIQQLSEHFSLAEAFNSTAANNLNIDNTTTDPALLASLAGSAQAMERVRMLLGNKPIRINSWYRCLSLNTALGSKPTSQHLKGEAIDFICPTFGTPLEICKKLIGYKVLINFDQLILEHSWVHVSFAITTKKPRSQVLSLLSTGGYATGLTNREGVKYD